MSDSIADLLKKRDYDEPPEVAAIKRYLRDSFEADGRIAMRDNQIIITVASASLAGTLRLRLPELKRITGTNKRLVIRIG